MKEKNFKYDERAWGALRLIYRSLSTDEGQKIIKEILENKGIRSKELYLKTDLPASKFYASIRQLEKNKLIEKTVEQDRSVRYTISPFGQNILHLSMPLLDKVSKDTHEKLIEA